MFYKETTEIKFSLMIRILFILDKNLSFIEAESRMVVVWAGGGVGAMERCWSKILDFQLCSMKKF